MRPIIQFLIKGGFLFVLALFLFLPGVSGANMGQGDSSEAEFSLTIHNDQITARIDQEPLQAVLSKLAQQFRFRLFFQEGMENDVISAHLREATLEEALQKLLVGNDYTIVKSRLPRDNPRSGSRLAMLFVLPRDGGSQSQDHSGLAPRLAVEGKTPVAPIAYSKDHPPAVDPAKVQELAGDLLVSDDPREREAGVELLADLHSPEAGHLFRQALGQDPDAFVRERAAKALGESWDPQHVGALAEALVKDPDVDVRRSAALAMGEIGAPEAISALQRALDDLNPEVRGSAVQALGDFADSQATSLLRGAMTDPDPEVRKSAAYQLKRR